MIPGVSQKFFSIASKKMKKCAGLLLAAAHDDPRMKIKPLNKSKRNAKLKSKQYHYWLAEEPQKKSGRLPQLNKKRRRKFTNVLASLTDASNG